MTQQKAKKHPVCPFCDDELMKADMPFCQPCSVNQFRCPKCGKSVPRDSKKCPNCGASLKAKATT